MKSPTTQKLLRDIERKAGTNRAKVIAAILGVTVGSISNYRHERSGLDEEAAMEACKFLDIKPEPVLAKLQMERAKTPAARLAWRRVYLRCGGAVAAVLASMGLYMQTLEKPKIDADDFAYNV